MSLLETRDVQSGYGRIPVLHGVSVSVEPGEITAVLGPNGAGKSTLMKTIARVLSVISGEISFDGQPVTKLEPFHMTQRGLGYVPQEKNVFPDLSVEENLNMGAYLTKGSREGMQRAFSLYPILEERRRQKAGTLSGGERQMLAVARALMLEPKLLIVDEPTSGLAPNTGAIMIRSILEINKGGTAILWVVEENPRDVLVHCKNVYLLESGLVSRSGTGKSFLEDEHFDALFLGHREAQA